MIVLGIAAWFVLLVLMLGIASLSLIYLERRELLARADALSLEAAFNLGDRYFVDGDLVPGGPDEVREVASSAVDETTRLADPTGIEDRAAVVSLSRTVRLPFVPESMPFSSVDIKVTSRSSLHHYDE